MRTQFLCTHWALLRTVTVVGVLTICALSAARTEAQTNSTWNGGTGNWSNAANWSNGVPNGDFNALISNGGPISTANLDMTATVANLSLDAGNTLNILTGNTLTFQAATGSTASGEGTINLLNGGGIVVGAGNHLSTLPSIIMTGPSSFISGSTGSESVSFMDLVRGSGNIGNLQIVATDVTADGGTLTINPNNQGLTINNTLRVMKGSTLNITGGPFNNFNPTTGVLGVGGEIMYLQGTLRFDDANVLQLGVAQHLTLDGPGAQIVNQFNQNALSNLNSLGPNAELDLLNGADLSTSSGLTATIHNLLSVLSGSTLNIGGNLSLSAGIGINASTMTVGGDVNAFSTDNGGSVGVTNGGTFNVRGNYAALSQAGFASGLSASGGSTVNVTGDFENTAGPPTGSFTLLTTGSVLNVGGNLTNSGPSQVTLDGGSTLNVQKDLNLLFANGGEPSLAMTNGSVGTVQGTLNNSGGTLQIDNTSVLNVKSAFNQIAGNTTVNGLLNASGSGVNIQGGTLSGTGVVNGNILMAGAMMPGDTTGAGAFTINGSYTQTSSGSLIEEVGWVNGMTGSLLHVNGTANLDGTLALSLLAGYTPMVGDSFILMTFLHDFGVFDTITGLNLGNNESLQVFYDPHDIRVQVVQTPEPASILFMLVGVVVLIAWRNAHASLLKRC